METRQPIFYLSGKITGDPDYREKFRKAAERLQARHPDAWIINPAENLPDGCPYWAYMRICLAQVEACDAIFMLDDWLHSQGAAMEVEAAKKMGKQVCYFWAGQRDSDE